MALNAANVRAGKTGALYFAPIGTTAPTSPTATLDPAFKDLGYIDEEGVKLGFDDSTSNKFAWQGAALVRTLVESSVTSINFNLIETKGDVLSFFFPGSTMTEVAADNFRLDGSPLINSPFMFVADVIDGTNRIRLSFGNAELVSRGEVTFANTDIAMWPATLNFYPDANGLPFQFFSNDPDWALT